MSVFVCACVLKEEEEEKVNTATFVWAPGLIAYTQIVTNREPVFTQEELMICDEANHYTGIETDIAGAHGANADKHCCMGMKVHSDPFRRNEADSGSDKMMSAQV